MALGKKPKLGEVLVSQNAITAEQLEKALSNQVVFGGRLGTSLVELNMMTLDTFADHLAIFHDLPNAASDAFAMATADLLERVPGDLCAQQEIFPLYLDNGKVLYLAMCDPHDLHKIDELAFSLGVRIQAFSVPEMRLLYALETYYGIRRNARFLRMPQSNTPQPASSGQADTRRYMEPTVKVPPEAAGAKSHVAKPVNQPAAEEDGLVFLDEFQSTKTEDDELDDFEVDIDDVEDIQPASGATPSPSIDDVFRQLQLAESAEEVTQLLVRQMTRHVSCSVLFLIRGEMAMGQAASGTGVEPGIVKKLVLPLGTPSLLQRAMQSKQLETGAADKDVLQPMIANYLRSPAPKWAAVVPIMIKDRIIALLNVQSSSPSIVDGSLVSQLADLAAEASHSYTRIIAQKKNETD